MDLVIEINSLSNSHHDGHRLLASQHYGMFFHVPERDADEVRKSVSTLRFDF